MYSIYGDGICIYSDSMLDDQYKAINPKLKLADNTAGSLEMLLPPGNAGYDVLERLSSEIIVYRDDLEIWAGRILSDGLDFLNNRKMFCEGELSYLNDTTQSPAEYHNQSVSQFLTAVITKHNNKTSDVKKKWKLGAVTVSDNLYRFTNDESTLQVIKEKLLDRLGGHLRIRKVGGIRYLDYLAEYQSVNPQEIRFGINLLDFARDWDSSEYATVIMPRGARLESSPIEGLDAYVDVSSVNGGSRYVVNQAAVVEYGWIEAVVEWPDVTEPANLLTKAQTYLAAQQFDDLIVEISSVDMRYLGLDVPSLNILDQVRCVSVPHGMDRIFPITQLDIQLDKPDNSLYTLGEFVPQNNTGAAVRTGSIRLTSQLNEIPSVSSILQEARNSSSNLINSYTKGYISIIQDQYHVQSESLVISSQPWELNPLRYWIWNLNGLGFTNNGGQSYLAAITMDGQIVGQRLVAQSVMAESINVTYKQSLQNGGLATSLIFDGNGLAIYNGNLTIYDKPATDATRKIIFQFNTTTRLLSITGKISTNPLTLSGVAYTCELTADTSVITGQGVGMFLKSNGTTTAYLAKSYNGGFPLLELYDRSRLAIMVGQSGLDCSIGISAEKGSYRAAIGVSADSTSDIVAQAQNLYLQAQNGTSARIYMSAGTSLAKGNIYIDGNVFINGTQRY